MDAIHGARVVLTDHFHTITSLGQAYRSKIDKALEGADWNAIEALGDALWTCWNQKGRVFICGNGGSAGNAIHIANDLIYGVAKTLGKGLDVQALTANQSIITCLANDEGYRKIFSHQLAISAREGDLLIVLSGSGNSENILDVLQAASDLNVKSFAILGYSGGKAKNIADVPIHFPVDDMQVSEDLQMVVGHMMMQWMYQSYRKKHSEN